MTVAYNYKVSESGVTTFLKLLSLWKGSIYQLVWKELVIFVTLFYMLNFIYRFALDEPQKLIYEKLVLYCDAFVNLIPLSFVLGFFVSTVVTRWWEQFQSLPFPDQAATAISAMIIGNDEHGRKLRRTLVRYLNASAVLVYRAISNPVKKRFPTMEHLVDAGFLTTKELKMFDDTPSPHSKWYVPCIWFSNLLIKAYKERRIVDEASYRILFKHLIRFRNLCGGLYSYDWVAIPLVYTQVVTLANYTFFVASLMGRQLLDGQKRFTNHEDVYFPIFTFLQFFFYMGWFKVAEELMNPFGEDADDFDINWIIDRNLQVSFLIVDGLHNVTPELEKDIYWNENQPDLPYTTASKDYKKTTFMGSTANLYLDPEDMAIAQDLEPIPEDEPILNYQSGFNRLPTPYNKSKSDLQSLSVPNRLANLVTLRSKKKSDVLKSGGDGKQDMLAKDLQNLLEKSEEHGGHSDSELAKLPPLPSKFPATRKRRGSLFKKISTRSNTMDMSQSGARTPEMASSPGLSRRYLPPSPRVFRSDDAKIKKVSSSAGLKKKISGIFGPISTAPSTPNLTASHLPAAGFGISKILLNTPQRSPQNGSSRYLSNYDEHGRNRYASTMDISETGHMSHDGRPLSRDDDDDEWDDGNDIEYPNVPDSSIGRRRRIARQENEDHALNRQNSQRNQWEAYKMQGSLTSPITFSASPFNVVATQQKQLAPPLNTEATTLVSHTISSPSSLTNIQSSIDASNKPNQKEPSGRGISLESSSAPGSPVTTNSIPNLATYQYLTTSPEDTNVSPSTIPTSLPILSTTLPIQTHPTKFEGAVEALIEAAKLKETIAGTLQSRQAQNQGSILQIREAHHLPPPSTTTTPINLINEPSTPVVITTPPTPPITHMTVEAVDQQSSKPTNTNSTFIPPIDSKDSSDADLSAAAIPVKAAEPSSIEFSIGGQNISIPPSTTSAP